MERRCDRIARNFGAVLLSLIGVGFLLDGSSASCLYGAASLCFAWTAFYMRPPAKVSMTIGKAYDEILAKEYRSEMAGILVPLAGFVMMLAGIYLSYRYGA